MNSSEGNTTDHYLESSPEGAPQHPDTIDTVASSVEPETASNNDIEKIRDILFGSQFRSHEKLFNHLEERMAIEYAKLKNELSIRLDEIESNFKREIESLSDRLMTQRNTQDLALEMLAKGQNKALQDLEWKVDKLNEATQQKHEEVVALIEREVRDLYTADQAARSRLSALFSELSERLSATQTE